MLTPLPSPPALVAAAAAKPPWEMSYDRFVNGGESLARIAGTQPNGKKPVQPNTVMRHVLQGLMYVVPTPLPSTSPLELVTAVAQHALCGAPLSLSSGPVPPSSLQRPSLCGSEPDAQTDVLRGRATLCSRYGRPVPLKRLFSENNIFVTRGEVDAVMDAAKEQVALTL